MVGVDVCVVKVGGLEVSRLRDREPRADSLELSEVVIMFLTDGIGARTQLPQLKTWEFPRDRDEVKSTESL